ncbi:MAG: hypothetical protein HYW23_00995 [Candidatus Aenigmarchaeota archaeon]|nr:hypothetical protein [Candidatus Aenigmarchaeota archaeon]
MLLLGHIGITAFIAGLIYMPLSGMILGVLLPDIIDKSLFFLGIAPCSRFIAHTIFFFPLAGLLTYAITKNKKLAFAVTLGIMLHLVEDLHDSVPFLYPLKNYAFLSTCGFGVSFSGYFIVTEVIGAALLLFMAFFNSQYLYIRKLLWDFIIRFFRGNK